MEKNDHPYPPAPQFSGGIVDPPAQYGLSAEDKKARVLTLGASEIAAVAGIHPYKNALDVYLSKTQQAPITDDDERLAGFSEWGHRLEPMIAQKYADVHGVSLIFGERTVHPTESWMSATPDRLVIANWGDKFAEPDRVDRLLELKNRNAHVAAQFGETGSDIVPMDIAAQAHWQMEVTGIVVCDIAVLIGGNYWDWFRIHRDEEIIATLKEKGYDFWHNYVLKRREPAIDGSESWKQYVTQKFAKHTEILKPGEESDFYVVQDLEQVKAEIKALEKQKNQLETQLKAQIGEAAGLEWPNGVKLTWKRISDSTGVDYQAVAFELAARAGISLEEQRALAEQHTVVTKQGFRRMHLSIPKELKK